LHSHPDRRLLRLRKRLARREAQISRSLYVLVKNELERRREAGIADPTLREVVRQLKQAI